MLKPHDMVLLLALIRRRRSDWDFEGMSRRLRQSVSAVHRSLGRLETAQLYSRQTGTIRAGNALEFILHAVKYITPLQEGPIARGVVTGASAEPVRSMLSRSHEAQDISTIWVWPDHRGDARGTTIIPLTSAVPGIALDDAVMHRRLAALDSIRGGRARERSLAESWFREEILPT